MPEHEMTLPDLKPCPFCGGKADFWWRSGKYSPFIYVQCQSCEAQTRVCSAKGNPADEAFWDQDIVLLVAEKWNRRMTDAEL